MKHQPNWSRRRRMLVTAIAIPALYVLSSGPALSFAFTWRQPTVHDEGDGNLGVTVNLDEGPWWPVVYAPLQWIAEQTWGEWLCWYWELFPVSADRQRPASSTRTPEETAFHRPYAAIRLEPGIDRVDLRSERQESEVDQEAGNGPK
jgi:hypothetical protein